MLLFIYVIVCLLVAFIAQRRGHNLLLYFVLSIALTPFITTLLLLFLIPSGKRIAAGGAHEIAETASHHITCGHCRRLVQKSMTRDYCAHCGELL